MPNHSGTRYPSPLEEYASVARLFVRPGRIAQETVDPVGARLAPSEPGTRNLVRKSISLPAGINHRYHRGQLQTDQQVDTAIDPVPIVVTMTAIANCSRFAPASERWCHSVTRRNHNVCTM